MYYSLRHLCIRRSSSTFELAAYLGTYVRSNFEHAKIPTYSTLMSWQSSSYDKVLVWPAEQVAMGRLLGTLKSTQSPAAYQSVCTRAGFFQGPGETGRCTE
jgi:hypothetical protein